MRKIEFRGKGISCPNEGEWLYGYYNTERTGTPGNPDELVHYIRERCGINNPVDPATVGQFTGMYDKNDKPVFDGDILQFGERRLMVWWNDEAFQWQAKTVNGYDLITFDIASFCTNWTNIDLGNIYSEIPILGRMSTEIIGNIHDNPELIQ